MTDHVHDLVGIGLGPFNLGLAALIDDASIDLDAVFLEQKPAFNWHRGMLIEGTTLEVPFLADVVTLADPSNPHTYLNYLRERDRLYEFYFYEDFFIPRREYNDYCQWVAARLDTCRFNRRVTSVRAREDGLFVVDAIDPETGERYGYLTRDVVMGIGTRPTVPDVLSDHLGPTMFHSASYLDRRERCLDADSVTVVGSGQSAAEIFRDLLERMPEANYSLDWITRSRGFFQMIDAKLGHMIYTPDYTEYFYDLPQETKDELLAGQDLLYKGIDKTTSAKIYDALYEQSIGNVEPDVGMIAATEIRDIETISENRSEHRLICKQWQEGEKFIHPTEIVVLATGYERPDPAFLAPLDAHLLRDGDGRFRITADYRLETSGLDGDIFVQNAELHTHGINAPDLGLGCDRNAKIINTLAGEELYPAGRVNTFQKFKTSEFIENRRAQPVSKPVRRD